LLGVVRPGGGDGQGGEGLALVGADVHEAVDHAGRAALIGGYAAGVQGDAAGAEGRAVGHERHRLGGTAIVPQGAELRVLADQVGTDPTRTAGADQVVALRDHRPADVGLGALAAAVPIHDGIAEGHAVAILAAAGGVVDTATGVTGGV